MPEQRRRFSPQFKAGAVQLVLETGRPIAQVARELGIYDGTLGNWVNAWRRDHPEPEQPLSPVERARIAWMCRMLGVPRSTFYAWRHRAETPTAARRRELAAPVRRVFDESRQTSGCRRVAAQLNREGTCCSVGLVADLMRELGLKALQPRAQLASLQEAGVASTG